MKRVNKIRKLVHVSRFIVYTLYIFMNCYSDHPKLFVVQENKKYEHTGLRANITKRKFEKNRNKKCDISFTGR